MTNKELIEILHNIPQEVFQSKNHEKLPVIFHDKEPKLKLITFSSYEVLELTLYYSMEYDIWSIRSFKDIENQIESYLNILGFTALPQTMYSATTSRYTPKLAVDINNIMTDTEIMKLMQLELDLQK